MESKLAIDGGKPTVSKAIPIANIDVGEDEIKAISEVIRSKQISRGPKINGIESRISNYVGCKDTVIVSSGSTALHLALLSLDLPKGSEVIVPSFTFAATALTPIYCGLKPVFADIDEKTFNISPESIASKITPKTKAIIPVHFAGRVCEMDKIRKIADEHNLKIIEDAAHAIGLSYKGKKIGSNDNLACFSFFATKNITSAEGGAVSSNDAKLLNKIRLMKGHCVERFSSPSAPGFYDIKGVGFNYQISNLNLAVLDIQLNKVDAFNRKRRENAELLNKHLKNIRGIKTPEINKDHIFHLYNILLDKDSFKASRDKIIEALIAEGVGVGLYYPPVHLFTYFRKEYGTKEGDLPVTEDISKRTITLPLYPSLSEEQIKEMALAVDKVISYYRK